MKYVIRTYPKQILLFSVLSVILAILNVSNALVLQLMMNVATKKSSLSYSFLVLIVISYIIINAIFYYFQQYNSEYLAKKSISLYRNIIFERISAQRISSFTKKDSGEYISLMTSQMDTLEQNYFTAIFWGSYLLIQFITACIVAFFINPVMALVAIILSIPNMFLPLLFRKVLEKTTIKTIKATDTYISKISDYLKGFVDWKINGGSSFVKKQEKSANNTLLANQKNEVRAMNLSTVFNNTFSNILYLGTWLIGSFLILNKSMTVGAIVAFSQLVTNISFPIYSFSDMFSQIVSGKKLFKEIESSFVNVKKKSTGIQTIADFKNIKFNNVSVVYNSERVVKIGNLEISNDKKYVIHGPSGSGKTTLFKLLTKQILDYQGSILFNNINIKKIKDNSIFSQVSYLPQSGHIFSTTLINNLTLFNAEKYSKEDLFKVLRFVELKKWANEEGLYRKIDPQKISGGEAKRIELARLLLDKKNILILDEFSSGLDEVTRHKIESKLFNLESTILYITHNLDNELREKADEIIEIKK